MADRTSQPGAGVGIRASLAASARFLWNGADPDKNQIGGASSTTGLRGTTVSGGAAGQYQHFNTTAGQQLFGVTLPTGAYTVCVGLVFPSASVAFQIVMNTVGGNGFRVEGQTTGGGVYTKIIHTGSAAAANEFVTGVGSFNSSLWTYVARFNGTTLTQYLKRGDGTTATTVSETITYAASSGSQIGLGAAGSASQGLYAAALINGDVGDTEALALRDNIWRLFEETGGDTTPPTITVPGNSAGSTTATRSAAENQTAVTTLTANETVTWSITGGADQAKFAIGSSTGVLTFVSAPDFEAPGDADTNNVYVVTVTATDAATNASSVTISVTVTDAADPATSISVPLKLADGTTAAASLTGVRWMLLGQSAIAGSATVLASGTGESTDGSGNLVIDVTGLGLVVGNVRYLIASASDGTVGTTFRGWQGPVTAA